MNLYKEKILVTKDNQLSATLILPLKFPINFLVAACKNSLGIEFKYLFDVFYCQLTFLFIKNITEILLSGTTLLISTKHVTICQSIYK